MKIVFATSNQNKAKEIQKILPSFIQILTLKDLELDEDIPETADTMEGNAVLKSEYIVKRFGIDCFADDSGLEIEALDGEPGVYSARYAGEERDDEKNLQLVLNKMEKITNRTARFKTVIALSVKDKMHLFEGIVEGKIGYQKKGVMGFGYDPIFEPEDCGKTFAEMSIDEKNKYSHRARAIEKMIQFIELNGVKE